MITCLKEALEAQGFSRSPGSPSLILEKVQEAYREAEALFGDLIKASADEASQKGAERIVMKVKACRNRMQDQESNHTARVEKHKAQITNLLDELNAEQSP